MKEPEFYNVLIALGGRIKQIRKQQKKSLVSIEVFTGISGPDLSKLETGRPDQNPELYTLFRIANALNTDIGDLFRQPTEVIH